MRDRNAKKPQVGRADVAVTIVERLLTQMRPIVIIGTILVICLAVYGMAWVFGKR